MKSSKAKTVTNSSERSKAKGKAANKKAGAAGKENKALSCEAEVALEYPSTPQKKAAPVEQIASATKPPSERKTLGRLAGKKLSSLFDDSSLVKPSLFQSEARVKKVYKCVQKCTGALGGNGYDGAIYGELTLHSMQKVIDFLVDTCEMGPDSMFIDVGSGLGKPNFHACQDPGVRVSIGIELEEIRWQLAMQNLKTVLAETKDSVASVSAEEDFTLLPGVNFIHGDIFDVVSTDPFTHIYMYDLGFPPPLQQKIAEYFNASTHARYLVSYRPPRRVIHEYGYEVEEMGKMSTSMAGSGESHTAYFYKRTSTPAPSTARVGTSMLQVPAREGSLLIHSDVVCSNYFKNNIEFALGPVADLAKHVDAETDKILSAGRPKRERKTRNLNL